MEYPWKSLTVPITVLKSNDLLAWPYEEKLVGGVHTHAQYFHMAQDAKREGQRLDQYYYWRWQAARALYSESAFALRWRGLNRRGLPLIATRPQHRKAPKRPYRQRPSVRERDPREGVADLYDRR